ncbi:MULTISPECIES: hypothetical protein, partial [unclassified Xanthobacter]
MIGDLAAWRRAAMGYAALIGVLSLCALAAERAPAPGWVAHLTGLLGGALPVFGLMGAVVLLLSPAGAGGALRILRQVNRGMGWLPDYGRHPGTGLLVALTGAGALAGARGGWEGALAGAALVLLPM